MNDELNVEVVGAYWDKAVDLAMEHLPGMFLAIIVLIVGLKIIAKLVELVSKAMNRAGISESIRPFLSSMVGIGLKVLLIFSIAEMVGVNTTSFMAVLAAAGFAVGLALQGSLSNFAAGIIVLVFRPYKVNDWIEVEEKFGKVEEIQIFNTIIITPGSKTLIIPNGKIVESVVTNYSKKGYIRMELEVTMPYAESFPKVKSIIKEAVKPIDKILKDPEMEIGISSYDSHNIILNVRPFVLPDDYWPVQFEVYERIKAAFHANNIQVAYSEGVELGSIGE